MEAEKTLLERIHQLDVEVAAMRMLSAFLISQFERMNPGFAEGAIAAFDESVGSLLSEGTRYDVGPTLRAEFISLLEHRHVMPKSPPANEEPA